MEGEPKSVEMHGLDNFENTNKQLNQTVEFDSFKVVHTLHTQIKRVWQPFILTWCWAAKDQHMISVQNPH